MVRGGMRGGGRIMRGGIRPPFKKPFVPRHPFDVTLAESFFPRVQPVPDDSELFAALIKRNQDLTPTEEEKTAIINLVTKVQGALDNLLVAPGDFSACQLYQVRQVGAFKKDTILTGHNVADIVVILTTLPTKEACETLAAKVETDMQNSLKTEVLARGEQITRTSHERGFDIANSLARVRVLIATLAQNVNRCESGIHLEQMHIVAHLAAVRHARWFEENAHHSTIKVLIRLLKDMTKRFDAFAPLTPWMIDLLSHLAIMNNPSRQALPINLAFRRVFQLLSAGLFLPGSAGITDPCEPGHLRVHTVMSLEEQDRCCLAAQSVLRVLTHGGCNAVLGLEHTNNPNFLNEMTVWNGIVVSAMGAVYEKPSDKQAETENMEMVEDDNAEGADEVAE